MYPYLSADALLLPTVLALTFDGVLAGLVFPSTPPTPLDRDEGVLTRNAPDPPNLGVKGLLLLPGVLGLLREDEVEGRVLKDAAVRMGEGGRGEVACMRVARSAKEKKYETEGRGGLESGGQPPVDEKTKAEGTQECMDGRTGPVSSQQILRTIYS